MISGAILASFLRLDPSEDCHLSRRTLRCHPSWPSLWSARNLERTGCCDGLRSLTSILWSSQCDFWALLPIFVAPKARHVGRGLRRLIAGCDRCRRDARRDHDLPYWLNGRLSPDNQVMLGGVVCSATLLPVALLSSTVATGCAMFVFGCGWIACCVQPFGDGCNWPVRPGCGRGAWRSMRRYSMVGWGLEP